MGENNIEYVSQKQFYEMKEESEKEKQSVYVNSDCLKMIREQEKNKRHTVALFADIDNTLKRKKGDRDRASEVLFRDLQRENYPIIAVTGNHFSVIEKRIQSRELPYYQIIAGAVGTEIFVLCEENEKKLYKKDREWEEILRAKGYDRLELAKKAEEMIEDLKEKNPEWQLNFQWPKKEKECIKENSLGDSPYKLSFHAFASSEASLEALKTEVLGYFLGQRAIFCEEIDYNGTMKEGDNNKKYNIDVLPATKADAVDYIVDKIGVDFKVVAGDSGNDIEMILRGGEKGIGVVVGGSKPELSDIMNKEIFNNKINKEIQITKDGKKYYHEISGGLGPESISRVFKMLEKIQKIK